MKFYIFYYTIFLLLNEAETVQSSDIILTKHTRKKSKKVSLAN